MFPRRKFITASENAKQNAHFNHDVGVEHVIQREPSVVDEFYFVKTFNEDGTESISVVDPIIVLFNQERLNDLGSTAAKAFIDSFAKQSDALSELRKKCTDDDLMAMMKSRHLQSPSEILMWCRYMENNVESFNKEVQALVEAQKHQQETIASSIEGSKTE